VRGGTENFNDLLRELMLSVVTNLWVDYLTEMEALREGIGLQAFGQRDPLVEYKRKAFDMFRDLYAHIRSQVVTYIFTYQYRGFSRLASAERDRAARQAVEAAAVPVVSQQSTVNSRQSSVVSKQSTVNSEQKLAGAKPKAESRKQAEPARKPVNASAGAKLGRNDPCWCGSGKKHKNCHMQSDAR
jgi:preprotein translocase subunit SecA